jgi:hypothetical protein
MKAKTFASLPEEKPAPVVAAKPPVIPEVNILVGKSAGEIRRIFGEPALLRQEAPAEVWQYLSLNCALHLFFYPPEGAAKGSELRVSHISVNGRDMSSKTPADPKKCFASELLQAGPDGKPAAS